MRVTVTRTNDCAPGRISYLVAGEAVGYQDSNGVVGALRGNAPARSGCILLRRPIMSKLPLPTLFDEPVGIVISRGREPETTPRFSAYVWAPYPGDVIEEEDERAA